MIVTESAANACPEPDVYARAVEGPLGRALSRLDAEATSPSQGSFDRTWWGWKFTDFSAARFQEGIFTLAWLATSPAASPRARGNARLVARAAAAVRFWTRLQHADGCFDEAYPFERSLAATAFTTFYVGCAVERLRAVLPDDAAEAALKTIDRAAAWLARHGEHHGVLSNHLAAAAAALQVAGDLLHTDRFTSARDRYLGIIYANQDPQEGWLREYGGADPGYQSHGMFYLAEIWRRTGDARLFECLAAASRFVGWFAHPDGTLGGEYASRGTKFAYPAAFEILAARIPEAAAVAAHLRRCIANGRGVGPHQVDAWNLNPMLNNYLFAADAGAALPSAPALPWEGFRGCRLFERCGLAVARTERRVIVAGLSLGGVVKVWDRSSGCLVYEDCGYAIIDARRRLSSQSESTWKADRSTGAVAVFRIVAPFTGVPGTRFTPFRFVLFRMFTSSFGRIHLVARALKQMLVAVLIRRKTPHPARLERTIRVDQGGELSIEDRLLGLDGAVTPLDRQVPFHMGSARYADLPDWLGAEIPCPPPQPDGPSAARRSFRLP